MQFGIKVRTVGNCRVKLPRNDRHLCKSDREMRDAVSLVRNASSSGNKLAVTTYTAIRDCNLALQRLRLPEHRIKREERGSLRLARLDAIILTRKTIILSSDFNDQL